MNIEHAVTVGRSALGLATILAAALLAGCDAGTPEETGIDTPASSTAAACSPDQGSIVYSIGGESRLACVDPIAYPGDGMPVWINAVRAGSASPDAPVTAGLALIAEAGTWDLAKTWWVPESAGYAEGGCAATFVEFDPTSKQAREFVAGYAMGPEPMGSGKIVVTEFDRTHAKGTFDLVAEQIVPGTDDPAGFSRRTVGTFEVSFSTDT